MVLDVHIVMHFGIYNEESDQIMHIHRLILVFAVHTVDLQWLKHRWLLYYGCFELVPESLGKKIP